MALDRANTVLTAVAAIAAVVGTGIALWQLGADDRKVVSFRNTCRSELDAIQDLIAETKKLDLSDPIARSIEGLRWSMLDARLTALQSTAPIIASGDTPLPDGLAEAHRLAEVWTSRKDFWDQSIDKKTFDSSVEVLTKASMPIIYEAAGKVR